MEAAQCLSWAIRVGLPMRRSLPVFPHKQTSQVATGDFMHCSKSFLFDHLVSANEQ